MRRRTQIIPDDVDLQNYSTLLAQLMDAARMALEHPSPAHDEAFTNVLRAVLAIETGADISMATLDSLFSPEEQPAGHSERILAVLYSDVGTSSEDVNVDGQREELNFSIEKLLNDILDREKRVSQNHFYSQVQDSRVVVYGTSATALARLALLMRDHVLASDAFKDFSLGIRLFLHIEQVEVDTNEQVVEIAPIKLVTELNKVYCSTRFYGYLDHSDSSEIQGIYVGEKVFKKDAEDSDVSRKTDLYELRWRDEVNEYTVRDETLWIRANNIENIHIITSTKGGVGKTLLSTAIIHAYQTHLERQVIGIDLNPMNQDLSRIYSFGVNPTSPTGEGGGANWMRRPTDNEPDAPYVLRLNAPYQLPDGTLGFWRRLCEAANLGAYVSGAANLKLDPDKPYDVVVDTNFTVANLSLSDLDFALVNNGIIRGGQDTPQRRIYIWIMWHYPALVDMSILPEALESPWLSDQIIFVHVLNPEFLIPPQMYMELRRSDPRLYQLAASFFEFLKLQVQDLQFHIQVPGGFLETVDVSNLEFLQAAGEDDIDIYRFKGLEELMKEDASKRGIDPQQIKDMFRAAWRRNPANTSNLQNLFSHFASAISDSYGGRPFNVVAIPVHDGRLRGVTEPYVPVSSMGESGTAKDPVFRNTGEIGVKIQALLKPISRALEDLVFRPIDEPRDRYR
jgi:hypothetical protein